LIEQLRSLRNQSKLPLAVGFGIGSPDQVAGLEGVADGVIVGSAIVRKIAEAANVTSAAAAVLQFAQQMQASVSKTKPSSR
jgi:tryptophan synthase alpha chain